MTVDRITQNGTADRAQYVSINAGKTYTRTIKYRISYKFRENSIIFSGGGESFVCALFLLLRWRDAFRAINVGSTE